MAIRTNRYRSMYEGMVRPINASTFPRHVFMRSPNQHSNVYDRVGDRENAFETTLVHLTERFNGKDVYLVGTMNQSTMLAQRTQKLIEEIRPDTVMVQTNQDWWQSAKLMKYVDSQEEMNSYGPDLDKYNNQQWIDFYWSNRKWLFLGRMWLYTKVWKMHFGFGNTDFTRPGLESKFACESAEKVGANLEFMGAEADQKTWQRLLHETRFNLPEYLLKRFQYHTSFYSDEVREMRAKIALVGPSAFTEKCVDSYAINWFIQCTDIFFPKLKKIMVDEKDEDLFKQIDQSKGEKIVVLVNQWHLEGIEHHWCHRYGQVPRSVQFPEGINPIGDMNLREGLFNRLYNALGRDIASKNIGAGPATYADWIIGYHRESNFQYEHRDM